MAAVTDCSSGHNAQPQPARHRRRCRCDLLIFATVHSDAVWSALEHGVVAANSVVLRQQYDTIRSDTRAQKLTVTHNPPKENKKKRYEKQDRTKSEFLRNGLLNNPRRQSRRRESLWWEKLVTIMVVRSTEIAAAHTGYERTVHCFWTDRQHLKCYAVSHA